MFKKFIYLIKGMGKSFSLNMKQNTVNTTVVKRFEYNRIAILLSFVI